MASPSLLPSGRWYSPGFPHERVKHPWGLTFTQSSIHHDRRFLRTRLGMFARLASSRVPRRLCVLFRFPFRVSEVNQWDSGCYPISFSKRDSFHRDTAHDALTGSTKLNKPQNLNSGKLFKIAARPQRPYHAIVRRPLCRSVMPLQSMGN